MNGVYQLVVLYGFGSVVPILNPELVLSRGYGIRNVTNLDGIRNTLDNAIPLDILGIHIPLATFLVIGVFCLFIVWFRRTKLGQDMRATGQDISVAHAAGIPVMRHPHHLHRDFHCACGLWSDHLPSERGHTEHL